VKSLIPSSSPMPAWLRRALTRWWFHALAGSLIWLLDLLTGRLLLFPILFVAPVSLSAWFCSARVAYVLAVLLPLGRLVIAGVVEKPLPLAYALGNMLIRVVVLAWMAYFVARTARQTRQLEERLSGLVTLCAWSKTVEYQGEWISFEEYLKRRFSLMVTHGISPAEMAKMLETETPGDGKPG